MQNPSKETFRHAIAVTAWRPGQQGTPYLYTLNLSCPDDSWAQFGKLYRQAAESFMLTQPSQVLMCHSVAGEQPSLTADINSLLFLQGYIPPDKEPWRFF